MARLYCLLKIYPTIMFVYFIWALTSSQFTVKTLSMLFPLVIICKIKSEAVHAAEIHEL